MRSIKRRLINLAGSSFVVSLPKKWVNLHKLNKGDLVNLSVKDDEIILSIDEKVKGLSKEVDVSSLDKQMIELVLASYYRAGYSEIKLIFSNVYCSDLKNGRKVKVVKVIRSRVSKLIGVEVVKQTSHNCVVKEVVSSNTSEFDNLIRRILLLLMDYSNLAESLAGGKLRKPQFDELSVDLETASRLINYCLRLLRRKGYEAHDETLFIYSYLNVVEEILSNYHFLVSSIKSLNFSKTNNLRLSRILKKTNLLVRGMYNLFYVFNLDKVNELYGLRREIFVLINKLRKQVKSKNELFIVDLLSMISNRTLKLVDLRVEMQA